MFGFEPGVDLSVRLSRYICSFLPRAVYTSGKASSAAGLTAVGGARSMGGLFASLPVRAWIGGRGGVDPVLPARRSNVFDGQAELLGTGSEWCFGPGLDQEGGLRDYRICKRTGVYKPSLTKDNPLLRLSGVPDRTPRKSSGCTKWDSASIPLRDGAGSVGSPGPSR